MLVADNKLVEWKSLFKYQCMPLLAQVTIQGEHDKYIGV
jgi:hypothetical protein